jgi:hypothetical protein
MSDEGARTFARYADPPNELGYCGPVGARAMLAGVVTEIERRARQFDGAWVYLEFLAEALGTSDPLARDVVESYWLGSDRLEQIPPADLVRRLEERFADQVGGTWRDSAGRARAHHSYQVFEVYPWAAMLRAGLPPGPAVHVLDRCRIRTGVVTRVEGEHVGVTSSALAWDGQRLAPVPVTERARWADDGRTLLVAPAVGDVVALHWDWVCDVLTADQVARLHRLEDEQREAVGLGGEATGVRTGS